MKKKIAIFQKNLYFGGAQKSLVNILKTIDYNTYDVDLYLIGDGELLSEVPYNVKIIKIKRNKLLRFIPIGLLMIFNRKKYTKSYDLIIDFGGINNIVSLEALSYRYKKRILWIHNDVYEKYNTEKHYRLLYKLAKNKLSYYDKYVCVSNGVKEGFIKLSGIDENKCVVIPNLIDVDSIFKESKEEVEFNYNEDEYNIVYLGKLNKQKGLDLLLPIFNEVTKRREDIHLYIIGNGPQISNLHNSVNLLKLNNKVSFLGSVANAYPYLDKMDGLVLYSRYEGQGTVLYEAKALGLEVFIPKHLEKYCTDIEGTDNMYGSLLEAEKVTKKRNKLTSYNQKVKKLLKDLLSD